jgi:hypothetical protein
MHPRTTGLAGIDPLSLRSLITFQALMVGFNRRAAMLFIDSYYSQSFLSA